MAAVRSFIDAAVHARDFRTVGIGVGGGVHMEKAFRPNVSELRGCYLGLLKKKMDCDVIVAIIKTLYESTRLFKNKFVK